MNALPPDTPTVDPALLTPVTRLTRDIRNAARVLSDQEARFLLDQYYTMQDMRIRSGHQERTLAAGTEPNEVTAWLFAQHATLEKQVARALDAYSEGHPVGQWARTIPGIGPVFAAALLAYIDIHQAPTVGHIWRYAGLDPTVKWGKGERRPWNADLKKTTYLIGESFVKVSGREDDIYGKVYKVRKEQEITRNEAGAFADQAREALATKRFGDDTQARKHYEAGKLPPARIHLRAKRYAVKLFLAHVHHVLHEATFGRAPPKPWIIEHGGHVHFLAPPNWPMPATEKAA